MKNFWRNFLIVYLGLGVLFQLSQHGTLFQWAAIVNIIGWLPLIVIHFFVRMVVVLLVVGLLIWGAGHMWPTFGQSVGNVIRNLTGSLRKKAKL